MVDAAAVGNADPQPIIDSSIGFLNALFDEQLELEEASSAALLSYYVDYYLVEFENGGFSQFVYNSKWRPEITVRVRDGMRTMGR